MVGGDGGAVAHSFLPLNFINLPKKPIEDLEVLGLYVSKDISVLIYAWRRSLIFFCL